MQASRALAILIALVAGCKVPPTPVYREDLTKQRHSLVNFRPDGKVLHPANFLALPDLIPLGSEAQITMYSESEIQLRLRGLDFTMVPVGGDRFPTDEGGMDTFLAKYFADSKDETAIGELGPPELGEKVLSGHHMIGMTKEQVYACLGPPLKIDDGRSALRLSREEILASDHWIYPDQWILVVPDLVDLYFGDGRLQKQLP